MSSRIFLAIIMSYVLLALCICTNLTLGASDSNPDTLLHSQLHSNHHTHRKTRRMHQLDPSLPAAPNPKVPPTVSYSTPANYNQWPFMVSISHPEGSGYNNHMCGGTLISKSLVLTAAHCVYDYQQLMSPVDYTLYIGINDLENDSAAGHPYEVRKVSKIVVHPDYKPDTYCERGGGCNAYDLALLVMDRQVTNIKPIALPKTKKLNFTNKSFYILGWGAYSPTHEFSKVLRYAQVPFIPLRTCELLSQKFNLLEVPPTHVCAGDTSTLADTCVGDSGGPLILQKADGEYMQVGVTSYGAPKTCGYTYYQKSLSGATRKRQKKGIFGVYSSTAVMNTFLRSRIQSVVAPT